MTLLHTNAKLAVPAPASATNFEEVAQAILFGNTPTIVTIPGLTSSDLETAWKGLFRFDQETSPEEKLRWIINVLRGPNEPDADDGVIPKEKYDKKIYFHLRSDTEQLLNERRIFLNDWQKEWFVSTQQVRSACVAAYEQIAIEMDLLSPGYYFHERFVAAMDQHVIRVLKYQPLVGTIAIDHCDRNFGTFHLAESAPGLYARHEGPDGPKTFYLTPETPQALCFPGRQLSMLTDGDVEPLLHGVDNTTPGMMRWAIVFFAKIYGRNGLY